MKMLLFAAVIFIGSLQFEGRAQEQHGNTLNVGVGLGGFVGYYGYLEQALPVFHANYELDLSENLTIAPFVSYSSFSSTGVSTDETNTSKKYHYAETVVPFGLKATWYFDDALEASENWDFYFSSSVGTALVKSHWDNNFVGNINYDHAPVFIDIHMGTEYHVTDRMGIFLDVSTNISSIGLAFH